MGIKATVGAEKLFTYNLSANTVSKSDPKGLFVQVEEIGDIEDEDCELLTEALENERERGLTDWQKTSLKKVFNSLFFHHRCIAPSSSSLSAEIQSH